jgi:Lrp/AsnC family transcriptional regulator, leucine-responsive regulatory protein
MRRLPEVVACHLVSGEADFLLEVVVPDLAQYETFLVGTLLKMPMIKDIRSNFAIRTVKSSAPLPLAHLASPAKQKGKRRHPHPPPSPASGRRNAAQRSSGTLSRRRATSIDVG